jgi:transcriptional regulator with XRE-family HTH domain
MASYMKISRKLYERVKLDGRKQFEIAREAGLNATTFSQILRGIRLTRVGDCRVLKIGELVGVPANECYELQKEETE